MVRPKWLAGLLLALVIAGAFAWLGQWQLEPRSVLTQEVAEGEVLEHLVGRGPERDSVAEPRRDLGFARVEAAARKITVPTLLVRGKQSDIVSEQGAQELLELVPGSRFVDISGAGHMVAGDDNDVFSDAVLTFLGEISGR